MELQKTFGPIVGMESLVQTRLALTDFVECADGTMIHYGDALEDCRGGYHRTDADQFEGNVEVVRDVLTKICEAADTYCTENEDYATGAIHIVDEVSYEWPGRVEKWILAKYHNECGYGQFDNCIDELVAKVCEAMDGGFDCECEYDPSEYWAYSGSGCCLFSLDIGEHEEQICVTEIDELRALHEQGILDDVLDELDHEFCINRHARREKNESTGYYEPVGRKTYNHHSEYPTVEVYTSPGGQWHYVVPEERMNELVTKAICELCRRAGK